MWLKLGEEELVNLEHCSSIKKEGNLTVELHYADTTQNRIVYFKDERSRDLAFNRVVKNLIIMQQAME